MEEQYVFRITGFAQQQACIPGTGALLSCATCFPVVLLSTADHKME